MGTLVSRLCQCRRLFVLILFLLSINSFSFSQVSRLLQFVGLDPVNPTSWKSSLNWDLQPPPGPQDTAEINNKTVDLDEAATVAGLRISGNSSFGGSNNITVTNKMVWGGGTLTGSGVTIIANGATLTSGTSIVYLNGRTLTVDGTASLDKLLIDLGTLAGSGTTTINDTLWWNGGTLAGSGETIVANGATLTSDLVAANLNLDGRTLTVNGKATQVLYVYVSNGAVINNNGIYETGLDIFLTDTSSSVFNNFGTFTKLGAGSSGIGVIFNNTGVVNVQEGSVQLQNGGSSSNSFILAENGFLEFAGGFYSMNSGTIGTGAGFFRINGGTLSVAGDVSLDKVEITPLGTLTGGGTLTVEDTLNWQGGTISAGGGIGSVTISQEAVMIVSDLPTNRTLDGRAIANEGTIVMFGDVTVANGADITNTGTFELQPNPKLLAGPGSSTSLLYNNGALLKTAGPPNGGTDSRIEIAFENAGTLSVDSISSLELTGPFANFSSNTLSGGSYFIEGAFKFKNAAIHTNNADLTLSGSLAVIQDSMGNNALANFDYNASTGVFAVEKGASLSVADSLRNEGNLTIGARCTLNVGWDYIQAGGTTNLRSGSTGGLSVASSEGTVFVTGGTFYGNGTITGSLVNSSALRVGDTVGTLGVSWNFAQTSSGSLYVEIGGNTPGTDLDQIAVTGTATLDGTINAKMIGGFVPTLGNKTFPVITYGAAIDTFLVLNDLDLDDGVRLIDSYGSTVMNVIANFAPLFTSSMNDTTINEDQPLSFTYEALDPEESSLLFSLISAPLGAALDSATGVFSWTPSFTQAGVHVIILGASDTFELTQETVTVTVLNVNRLPLFTKVLPDTVIAENQNLSFSLLGTDPDLEVLSFEKVDGPTGSTVSPGGVFSWTPTFSDSGNHPIIISLTDGLATVQSTANVYVSNVNRLPSFTRSFPDTSLQENSTFSFSLLSVDLDLDDVTFGKVEGPGEMTVSPAGEVSWNVTYSDSGNYQVVVSLYDGLGLVYDTATVIVVNLNRLPQFVVRLPDTTIAENQPLSFNLQGSDADLDLLSFAGVSGPTGVTVNTNGEFSWTPNYSESGVHQVVVSVFDGLDAVADTAFINVTNVNRLPVFTRLLPDTSVSEDDSLGVTLFGSDADPDVLTFSKVSGPPGAEVSVAGLFSWKTGYSDSGTHLVVVRLSDGTAAVDDTALITVLNVNRLPAAFALLRPADGDTVKLTVPFAPIEFQWRKSFDLDADTLRYTVHVEGPGLDTTIQVTTDTSVTLNIMDRLQSASQYTWSVRVTDRIDTVAGVAALLFRTSAGVTGVESHARVIPQEFALVQNYPNPFNPSTIIRYSLPVRSSVSLDVYDIIGKRIASLVESQQEAGNHDVQWDANAASGIYFYRLEAVGVDDPTHRFVKVRKMILLR